MLATVLILFVVGTVPWINDVHGQVTCLNGALLFQRSPSTSVRIDVRAERNVDVPANDVPTSACLRVCEGMPSCRSFSVDYTTRTCKFYSELVSTTQLIQRPGSVYFEKLCLPDVSNNRIDKMCKSRMWAVDKVRGFGGSSSTTLQNFIARLDHNVPNRDVCIRLCLEETAFQCASAVYNEMTRTCALNTQDRHTQPASTNNFQNGGTDDYYENQCIQNLNECQFLPQNNVQVVTIDYVTVARSERECREDCSKNTAIICRSYNYDPVQNSCMLSSDNTISLLGVDLPVKDGVRYGERRCRHNDNNQFQLLPQALALARQLTSIGPSSSQQSGSFNPNQPFPNNQGGSHDPNFFGGGSGFPGSNTNFQPGIFPVPGACVLEKTSGITVLPEAQGLIPLATLSRGVTTECATACRIQGPIRCPAFTVDYVANQCTVLVRPAQAALTPTGTQSQSYFEHVCYNTVHQTCQDKIWSFQRYQNTELRGFNDRVVQSISNRHACQQACLDETQFRCMSAEYDNTRNECRLSRESRLTRFQAFQHAPNIDYFENQCAPPSSTCNFARQDGVTALYADTSVRPVYTEDECRRLCQSFQNFTCVAASYMQHIQECLLSDDVTVVPQQGSVLLYSSCLSPVQVQPPTIQNTGPTAFGGTTNFGSQFPGGAGGGVLSPGGGNFGTFGGFNPQFQNPSTGFFPNQFQTGTASQNPFLTPAFHTGSSTPQFFGTGTFPQQGSFAGPGTFPQQGSFGGTGTFPQQGSFAGTGTFPQQGSFGGTGTFSPNPFAFGSANPQHNPQFFLNTGGGNVPQQFAPSGQFHPSSGFFPGSSQVPTGNNPFSGSINPQQFPQSFSGHQFGGGGGFEPFRNLTSPSNVVVVRQREPSRVGGGSSSYTRAVNTDEQEVEVMSTSGGKPIRNAPKFLRVLTNDSEPLSTR